ncbi:conserved hypothetical protein [Candidatus Desulfarcum epimagneticum]|uniref:Nucleotide-diphospho-sugar transferase domain-containing protein n=1 Tax=uncultured Desulfobacteraceae bacterium TaxID=218296 RepID=A0A484HM22_9BACT|nr:conserved hypothetical protein [uncultured Desulfobacteraceae bacterium]
MKKHCFCFVCQKGMIEIQAVLLALSLSRHVRCPYEMVVGIPPDRPGKPVMEILEELKAKMADIKTPVKNYHYGNKFPLFIKSPGLSEADCYVFLDSDILCLREFYGIKNMKSHDIGVRMAGCGDFHNKKQTNQDLIMNPAVWEPIYRSFGLPVPNERWVEPKTKKPTLPYFNAGFIAVKKGSRFPEKWLEAALKIEQDKNIDPVYKRPWLDQIAMSIAIRLLKLRCQAMGSEYNSYSKEHGKAIFFHYHRFENMLRIPRAVSLARDILTGRPRLVEMIRGIRETSGSTASKKTLNDLQGLENLLH